MVTFYDWLTLTLIQQTPSIHSITGLGWCWDYEKTQYLPQGADGLLLVTEKCLQSLWAQFPSRNVSGHIGSSHCEPGTVLGAALILTLLTHPMQQAPWLTSFTEERTKVHGNEVTYLIKVIQPWTRKRNYLHPHRKGRKVWHTAICWTLGMLLGGIMDSPPGRQGWSGISRYK